ncbi:Uncharacterised protein (plasmid) [Tsukamurella tyrosinosolvens]|uniref:Uncharacterized protein n=1 Tax=Tsukamurella tyrosinosolvens TaxID=57704 RepID=A0A1H4VEL1_TSUTY|nr:hypothetical protein [Tsukamurella tyrosinosolvens]KXO90996.1 hypothetical protein AXK58_21435 [Tsukamurella tyrosinosolvens]SEC79529.1 hypothetical protein SAMN04489793_3206 [Tsukamurella tyrosinosolvens]VEH90562.1 Uncharacterised protein [Tsukamurella tyrosinosolvens]
MSETTYVGDGTITTDLDGERGGRRAYSYIIRANGWEYIGNDLELGPTEEQSPVEVLADFLRASSEQSDLEHVFPEHVRAWAAENYDDLSILAADKN